MFKLKYLFHRKHTPSQGSSSKHSSGTQSHSSHKTQSIQSLNGAIDQDSDKKVNVRCSSSVATTSNDVAGTVSDSKATGSSKTTLKYHHSTGDGGTNSIDSDATSERGIDRSASIIPIKDNQMAAVASGAKQNTVLSSVTVTAKNPTATVHSNSTIGLTDTNNVQTDLYTLNPAFVAAAAAAGYQFINQEQQQILEATNNKMQELQNQLDRLDHEKLLAESRVNELLTFQCDVNKLKGEIIKMEKVNEKQQLEIVNLKYENESLRNRLRDVVNSPLSDAEKHQIIQESQRLHSSAPASIALPTSTENEIIGGITPCLTHDWDKHSSSSEISVACLQDKIIQMEETHYSTNEELQATLQELADLQAQLSDAQSENERLAEEKDVLFQSLCRQTEKLNDTRLQVNNLQELLLRDDGKSIPSTKPLGGGGGGDDSTVGNMEREKKLLELIKTTQDEREAVLVKREEINSEMQELRQNNESISLDNVRLHERVNFLENKLDAEYVQRKQIESQLIATKEDNSQCNIETKRLNTLLENAKAKIEDLEQELSGGDKTDFSDLLETARKEKDTLEEKTAELQDQASRSKAETRRLRDQINNLNEELKISKNNAKIATTRLEYCIEQLQQEKDKLTLENQQLCDNMTELQMQCKCHLEDKTQLQALLADTEKHLNDLERKVNDIQKQHDELQILRKQEVDEWQQFQSDLLLTVRVANDFKTEALSAREQVLHENKMQKEKIRMLEQQIENINKQQQQHNETQQSVLSTVQQEMASRRNKMSNFSRQDSRLSVKSLIETIENNKQQVKATEESMVESQYSSSTSLNSIVPDATSITSICSAGDTINNNNDIKDWSDNVNHYSPLMGNLNTTETTKVGIIRPIVTSLSISTKATIKEPIQASQHHHPQQCQQSQQTQILSGQQTTSLIATNNNMHLNNLANVSNISKSFQSGERKDPLNMLAKNGGSKRNALLKWCQNKTVGYRNIDITNFSSSWNDGLAFCAILHSYLPDRIPYDTLSPTNKRRNFSMAFNAAESVGISTTLNINDMCQIERPDWTQVMSYVTAIYKHFET